MKKNLFRLIVVIACVITVMTVFVPNAEASGILLRLGSSGSAVTELQTRLHNLGYLDFHGATGNFGTLTQTAVIRFQSVNGLVADGIAGPITLNRLYSNLARSLVLRAGSSGEAVQTMQLKLKSLGYFGGTGTGHFGAVTLDAVRRFQQAHGLAVDGIAGPLTRKMLFSNSAKNAGVASVPSNTSASLIADIALSQNGKPYAWGGNGPSSYDCSGLVYYAMTQAGYSVSRLSSAGYSAVTSWPQIAGRNNLAKGDLLFFRSDTSASIGHMGVYIGNGEFVHASSGQGRVMISTLDNTYWARNYLFARRVV